jgi:hypothetical protein
MAGGYPGVGRSQSLARPVSAAHFLFPTYARIVDRVYEDNIALQLETAEAFSPQGLVPRSNPDLGGASGGPVVRLNPEADLLPVELVGFIYEYHQGFERLYARPASLIDEAGRIRHRSAQSAETQVNFRSSDLRARTVHIPVIRAREPAVALALVA